MLSPGLLRVGLRPSLESLWWVCDVNNNFSAYVVAYRSNKAGFSLLVRHLLRDSRRACSQSPSALNVRSDNHAKFVPQPRNIFQLAIIILKRV